MPQAQQSLDSFNTRSTLTVDDRTYIFHDLTRLGQPEKLARLPVSLKILLENLLRCEDGVTVTPDDIEAVINWDAAAEPSHEIAYRPARVLLQDFTGVPAVVDLAAMRDAIVSLGGDAAAINPIQPADLVIDHSVQVDQFGSAAAFSANADREMERNRERYAFLRWGQKAFENFRVVPPDTGIVHQINLEYLAQVVFRRQTEDGEMLYPDTVVGTDSHTTMINGLGVVGWGVGGIEAEAAMLGQPVTMLVPQVVGMRLTGKLPEGSTATDMVLRVTELLRAFGVVGKFVEFFGPGLKSLTLEDKATISNMAPEYGATIGFFPVSQETLTYLTFSGRDEHHIAAVESYCKAQGIFHTDASPEPTFSDVLELDLGSVTPAIAGPKRPQDRIPLGDARGAWTKLLEEIKGADGAAAAAATSPNGEMKDGAIVIAAITSCTNTSNPSVLIAAGLLAKKAVERGLATKPWVKTSLAPGSKVVTDYLRAAGLMEPLEQLRFNLVGYGCTTCIGNSGPLPPEVDAEIAAKDIVVAAVLSGNRNFEGRVHARTKANYLASPPLVVAYALAGTVDVDLTRDAIGTGADGQPVYLRDIWPTSAEVADARRQAVTAEQFTRQYAQVFDGDEAWQQLPTPEGSIYAWDEDSTYIRKPAFFDGMGPDPAPLADVVDARVLVMVGDSITTDHISPAGSFSADTPAGQYLVSRGVDPKEFNSYGSRRGNHEVMVRGTFANIRLRNRLAPGTEGGRTRHFPDGEEMSIYDAAVKYREEQTPLIVLAGKEYGTGSSRDWAAKGTYLLGVRAVIAESFERIHRSNLIGMGVIPLQFASGDSQESLGLTGEETYSVRGIADYGPDTRELTVVATADDGTEKTFQVRSRIDTPNELEYYRHGGILQYVLRSLA